MDKTNIQASNDSTVKQRGLYLPMHLGFFNDSSSEKTEQATPKKKRKARDEGQVAKSQEISTAVMLIAGFVGLSMFGGMMLNGILGIFHFHWEMLPYAEYNFEHVQITRHVGWAFGRVLLIAAPMMAICGAVGFIASILQVGWHVTSKPMKPKFSKLNPLKGFKKILGLQSLVNFVKSLLKFVAVGIVIYITIIGELNTIPSLLDMAFVTVVSHIASLIINLGISIGVLFIFIAILDYAYTRWKHAKDLKMTKQEVKEEWKQQEGNPEVKGKIKQKMREVSMRRMMQNVPQADVIITNPTHYAVALKYDMKSIMTGAPVLVAKGVDFMAKRIREKGEENGVVIVENPPLARAIYADVEIDEEIPEELYLAVAEIMAFVYRLRNPGA